MKKGGYKQYTSSREYRNTVRLLYKDRLYKDGYSICLIWLNKMNSNLIDKTDDHQWACYYNLGVGMWGLKEYNKAVYFLKKSLEYTSLRSDEIKTRTVIAMCEEDWGHKERALVQYNKCLQIADDSYSAIVDIPCGKETKDKILECKASLLRNKGELLKDVNYIYESIQIYKTIEFEDEVKEDVILSKIDNNYKTICEIYITQNNELLANKAFKQINNKAIIKKLRNKMSI